MTKSDRARGEFSPAIVTPIAGRLSSQKRRTVAGGIVAETCPPGALETFLTGCGHRAKSVTLRPSYPKPLIGSGT